MNKKLFRLTAVLLFLLFWARLVATAVAFSATFDEPLHLLQAVLYWQQWPVMSVVQNPPLVNALIGLPLRLAFQPALPPDMSGAVFQDWLALGKQFMWQVNGNGLQMLFVGRLMVVWLALLLAALLARWAGRWFGSGAALVVLLLFTFDLVALCTGRRGHRVGADQQILRRYTAACPRADCAVAAADRRRDGDENGRCWN